MDWIGPMPLYCRNAVCTRPLTHVVSRRTGCCLRSFVESPLVISDARASVLQWLGSAFARLLRLCLFEWRRVVSSLASGSVTLWVQFMLVRSGHLSRVNRCRRLEFEAFNFCSCIARSCNFRVPRTHGVELARSGH